MATMNRLCDQCGARRVDPDDMVCRACGYLFPASPIGKMSAAALSERQRQRPLWLVGALTLLTFGLYFYWWYGATWAEIKRERDDTYMHPFWHVGTLLVPFYCYWSLHAHYRTINELRLDDELSPAFAPRIAVFLWIGVTASADGGILLKGWANTLSLGIELVLVTVLVVLGQAALNGSWRSLSDQGRTVPVRTNWAEWLLLVVGIAISALAAIGALAR